MGDENRLFIAVDLGAGSGRVFLAGFAQKELLLERSGGSGTRPVPSMATCAGTRATFWRRSPTGFGSRRARRVLQRPIRSVGIDCWGVDYGWWTRPGRSSKTPSATATPAPRG